MLIPMLLVLVIAASAMCYGFAIGHRAGRRSAFNQALGIMRRVKTMTDEELREGMPAEGGE